MCLKHLKPGKVREFVASTGLKTIIIPDSIASVQGNLLGVKNYKNCTLWSDAAN